MIIGLLEPIVWAFQNSAEVTYRSYSAGMSRMYLTPW